MGSTALDRRATSLTALDPYKPLIHLAIVPKL